MGWRERFGADDERAQIAARARALLDAAGGRPSPVDSSSWVAGATDVAAEPPFPSPPFPSPPFPSLELSSSGLSSPLLTSRRGGWVPPLPSIVPDGGRHAAPSDDPEYGTDLPDLPTPELAVRPVGPDRTLGEPAASGWSSWRERVRFEPGRRGLVAVAAVVVVVGSVAGGVMVRGGSSQAVTVAAASGAVAPSAAPTVDPGNPPAAGSGGSPTGPPATTSSAAGSGPAPSGSPAGTVTVDVAGLVVHPGVYTLPAGSRVEDALAAAGGARPGADLSTLNRARVLVDGEQLPVGVPGAVAPVGDTAPGAGSGAGTGSGAGAVGAGGLIDLNTAGLADLDSLPGVGPVLAQAILDWRTEHGRFASVGDLDQVTGIGPATFAKLRDLVTV